MALHVDIRKDLGDFTLQARFETGAGVTGILGASGCGKSMTLGCIAGVIKPDAGRIELDSMVLFDSERGINQSPQKRQVGLLFQNYALFPNMTVRQNLMTGLRAREKDRRRAKQQINEMMERFRLTGLEKHRPCQLSGGQQQRAALARILLSRPRLLMLDEPFSALDGYLRWNLELELSDVLKGFGGSILFVSHSRDEIYRLCDRVCVMDQGKSGPVIPVKQLFEAPMSRAAAVLSGCKNYSRARSAGERKVLALDWGVMLEYEGEVPEALCWVGVRSHYLVPVPASEKYRKNTFRCQVLRVVEDVFSMVILLRPEAGDSAYAEEQADVLLRAEMTKEFWEGFLRREDPAQGLWLHIEPKDVMLLT